MIPRSGNSCDRSSMEQTSIKHIDVADKNGNEDHGSARERAQNTGKLTDLTQYGPRQRTSKSTQGKGSEKSSRGWNLS